MWGLCIEISLTSAKSFIKTPSAHLGCFWWHLIKQLLSLRDESSESFLIFENISCLMSFIIKSMACSTRHSRYTNSSSILILVGFFRRFNFRGGNWWVDVCFSCCCSLGVEIFCWLSWHQQLSRLLRMMGSSHLFCLVENVLLMIRRKIEIKYNVAYVWICFMRETKKGKTDPTIDFLRYLSLNLSL